MSSDAKKKILVIRFSSLGDVILTTVLFPNLKAAWPNCDITILTKESYAPVFDHNPYVDHVRIFEPARQSYSDLTKEIRNEQFDIIIDLQNNLRSWFIRFVSGPPIAIAIKKNTLARRWLVATKHAPSMLKQSNRERILETVKALDIPVKETSTQVFPSHADDMLKMYSISDSQILIGIAPGAKHNTKRWSPERFAEAANRLAARPNAMIVLLGGKEDTAVADQILPLLKVPYKNLVGWTSIPELVSVTSKLSFLLTNDSGIMHIAEALNIPLVALFGPTVRAFGFAPYRPTSRVVEVVNLPCRPCTLHGDVVCPLKHHKCMDDLDINAVLFAASDVFSPPLVQA